MTRALAIVTVALLVSCGNRSNTYLACDKPDDCDVPEDVDPVCLDKSGEGFCSTECAVDEDCDYAEETEEGADYDFVCASFESENGLFCFPACVDGADEGEECPAGMNCRSTGGGNDNRKICFPEDPA